MVTEGWGGGEYEARALPSAGGPWQGARGRELWKSSFEINMRAPWPAGPGRPDSGRERFALPGARRRQVLPWGLERSTAAPLALEESPARGPEALVSWSVWVRMVQPLGTRFS